MKSHTLVLMFGAAFALHGGCAAASQKMYSATAEIVLVPWASDKNSPFTLGPDFDDPARLSAELRTMKSADAITPVMHKLKLDQIWAKRYQPTRASLPPQDALNHLRKVLVIESASGSTIVKVTAFSEVPSEAVDIANTLAEDYKAMRGNEDDQNYQHGLKSLQETIVQQRKAVSDAKAAHEKHEVLQAQDLLDALNASLKRQIADHDLQESRVRILTRAVAPPE